MLVEILCLSAGLYIACDLAEENVIQTRRFLTRALAAVVCGYVILALDDDVPTSNCLIGAACHLALLPLLRDYPILEIMSLPTLIAMPATLINHIIWFRHFLSVDVYFKQTKPSTLCMAGFFLLFVWLVPLGFFVGMTPSDECLPGTVAPNIGEKRRKKGFVKGVIDGVLGRSDENTGYSPGIGKQY